MTHTWQKLRDSLNACVDLSRNMKRSDKKVLEQFWRMNVPHKHSSFTDMGHIFFTIGIVLIVVFTVGNQPNYLEPWQALTLLVLGLIGGVMDLKEKYAPLFLMGFFGLLLSSTAPLQNAITYYNIGAYIKSFLMNMSLFMTLAVVMMSLRVVFRVYFAKE